MKAKEPTARIKINRLLEEAGWRFFDDKNGPANIILEPNTKITETQSLVNLYLHGFADPKVEEYDTLTSEDKWGEVADVILANPPFMSPKGGIKPHNRFGVQSKRSEVLFVDYIAEHLSPRGRAAIIVPEGIIFQSQGAYRKLRKMLVEKYHREFADDPERMEYFVPVRWIHSVPLDQAVNEIGMFGNQNTVCKPTTPKWRTTVERLKERWGTS